MPTYLINRIGPDVGFEPQEWDGKHESAVGQLIELPLQTIQIEKGNLTLMTFNEKIKKFVPKYPRMTYKLGKGRDSQRETISARVVFDIERKKVDNDIDKLKRVAKKDLIDKVEKLVQSSLVLIGCKFSGDKRLQVLDSMSINWASQLRNRVHDLVTSEIESYEPSV